MKLVEYFFVTIFSIEFQNSQFLNFSISRISCANKSTEKYHSNQFSRAKCNIFEKYFAQTNSVFPMPPLKKSRKNQRSTLKETTPPPLSAFPPNQPPRSIDNTPFIKTQITPSYTQDGRKDTALSPLRTNPRP